MEKPIKHTNSYPSQKIIKAPINQKLFHEQSTERFNEKSSQDIIVKAKMFIGKGSMPVAHKNVVLELNKKLQSFKIVDQMIASPHSNPS